MVASALGMILAVAVTAGILVRSDGPARPARGGEAATDDPLLRIDPTTNRVASSLALPALGRSVAAGAGFVWIGSNDTVSKLNPSTGTRVASIAGLSGTCNYGPACSVTSIIVAEGTVWAAVPITTTAGGGAVVEIDPRTNAIVRRVDVPTATNVVYLDGSLWVTDPARGQVFRIDPANGEIVATIPAESSARPSSISAGDGAVWVVDGTNGRVARIDARTNRVTREIPVEDAAGVAIGEGGVWVTSSTAGTVTEYSPDGDTLVGSVDIGTSADAVATSPGAVWVTSLRDGKVVRIDPSTREIEAVIPAPSNPVAVTVGEGAVWVLQAPGFSFSRG
jgi:sugar lactone lactonase YvrE